MGAGTATELSEAPTRLSFPSAWQAVGLLALLLLLQLLLGVVLLVARPVLPVPPDHPGAQGVVALLAGIAVAWYGWRRRGGSLAATFSLRPVSPLLLVAVILTVAGLGIVLSEVDNALRSVLPPPQWLAEFFEQFSYGRRGMWGAVFAVVIAAPIAEELVFRGVILQGFLARYRVGTAVAASALLFGVAHGNPWQLVGATAFGIVAAWWFLGTRSLMPCILGHALGNGLPSLLQAAGLDVRGYTSGMSEVVQFQPLWFDAIGVVLLGAGLWLTRSVFAAGFSVAADPQPS